LNQPLATIDLKSGLVSGTFFVQIYDSTNKLIEVKKIFLQKCRSQIQLFSVCMLKNMIMKRKNVTWMLFLLIAFGISEVPAQTAMNVLAKSGTLTSFELRSINTLIFTSGIMSVNKTDGSILDFAMADVRNLNFETITSVDNTFAKGGNMLLYPNPVMDHLQIRYESVFEENVSVTIINVQGAVVLQQKTKNQRGTNNIDLPIRTLPKGMYLFRLQQGNNIEMTKFIKN